MKKAYLVLVIGLLNLLVESCTPSPLHGDTIQSEECCGGNGSIPPPPPDINGGG